MRREVGLGGQPWQSGLGTGLGEALASQSGGSSAYTLQELRLRAWEGQPGGQGCWEAGGMRAQACPPLPSASTAPSLTWGHFSRVSLPPPQKQMKSGECWGVFRRLLPQGPIFLSDQLEGCPPLLWGLPG